MKKPKYYWGVLGNKMFYVTDAKFKMLDECDAFTEKGNFTQTVYDLAKKYGFTKTLLSNLQTEHTIEELKKSIQQSENLLKKYLTRKQRESK